MHQNPGIIGGFILYRFQCIAYRVSPRIPTNNRMYTRVTRHSQFLEALIILRQGNHAPFKSGYFQQTTDHRFHDGDAIDKKILFGNIALNTGTIPCRWDNSPEFKRVWVSSIRGHQLASPVALTALLLSLPRSRTN